MRGEGTSDDPQRSVFVGPGTSLEVPPMENLAEESFRPMLRERGRDGTAGRRENLATACFDNGIDVLVDLETVDV